MNTSYKRRAGKNPAYWITEFGVLHEVELPDTTPLMWKPKPLPKVRLKNLFLRSENDPLKFARLVEAEHGID